MVLTISKKELLIRAMNLIRSGYWISFSELIELKPITLSQKKNLCELVELKLIASTQNYN